MSILLGKYRVVATTGSNTYSVTYDGNEYTIIRADIVNSLMSVTLVNLMSHPNIIKPLEYLPSADRTSIYIVTNNGHKTLSNIIYGPDPLDEYDIRIIAKQLLSAMDYMYRNRITPRSLNPRSIGMDGINVRIMDMSNAHFIPTEVIRPMIRIEPDLYSAPEIHLGYSTPISSDVWSLGIILMECFNRHLVVEGNIQASIASMSASIEAKQCLQAMLHTDHSMRPLPEVLLNMPWLNEFPYQKPEVISFASVNIHTIDTNIMRIAQDTEVSKYATELIVKIPRGKYRKDMDPILVKIAVYAIDSSRYDPTGINVSLLSEVFELLRYDIIMI